jgi:aquaporin Z
MAGIDVRKLAAELVGTFVFFLIGFMGVNSTISFGLNNATGPDLIVIAFAFGLGLFVAIMIAGSISGGHFNPAVTIAVVLNRGMDVVNAVGYIVAQLIGGILAALLVVVFFDQTAITQTITKPGAGVSDLDAVLIETVFTAIFIAVIVISVAKVPAQAAFAIPLALIVIHLAIVPFTGSSVNPARSIASAVVGGDLSAVWIYIVGPVIGAVIGWGEAWYMSSERRASGA